MLLVVLTAIGVGSSTVIGALIGFMFKSPSHRFNDGIMGFAAGIMLAASFFGLIIPSIEAGGSHGIWITSAGVIVGALIITGADVWTPHLHNFMGIDKEKHNVPDVKLNKVILFVLAIAIHNFPEGIAAGVGFGTNDIGNALSVAIAITLQNIPEGFVIVSPLLLSGVSKGKVLLIAIITGLIEVVGTFLGYFAVTVATFILPFALAFAAGAMIYVISDEIIPETHSHGYEKTATFSLIGGFIVMMILAFYIG